MPEFGVLFLINAFFIIHAARTGRFWPWAYVILFLPIIGVAAYIIMEVIPEYRRSPHGNRAQTQLVKTVNPERRYRQLRAELEIAETLGNRLALAHECLALRKYDEALLLYEEILKSPQGDEPSYYFGKAQAEFGLGQAQETLTTLDELKRQWPNYQSQEGHLLYARALEQTGREPEAAKEYEALSRYFSGQEANIRRMWLLDRLGDKEGAQTIADEVLRYAKRCPNHAKRRQAEWFAAARSYVKSTSANRAI